MKYTLNPTSGLDTGTGSETSPWKTFEKASQVMKPGDVLQVRGGTHKINKATGIVNRIEIRMKGISGNLITIEPYPGEKPVFDFSTPSVPGTSGDGPIAVKLIGCQYLHMKGIRFTGLAQLSNNNVPAGMVLYGSSNNTIENCEVDHIGGYGFVCQHDDSNGPAIGSNNNKFLNCDVHHLDDKLSGSGNANGFMCTGGDKSTGNVFEGCRGWFVSDDAFDFFNTNGNETMKNCWAFWNGYSAKGVHISSDQEIGNGFKLGPTNVKPNMPSGITRIMNNCLAFENLANGIDQNCGNENYPIVQMINVTSYKNGNRDYSFGSGGINSVPHDVQKNIGKVIWGPDIQKPNNSWTTGPQVTDGDFNNLNSAGMDGPRGPNGELPVVDYLWVKTSSPVYKKYGYFPSQTIITDPAPPPPPPPPPPTGTKIKCSRIWYDQTSVTNAKTENSTFIEIRTDGVYNDKGVKRDVVKYKDEFGKWKSL